MSGTIGRRSRRGRLARKVGAVGLTLGLILGSQVSARAGVLSGQESSALQRVPQLTPDALGSGALDGLHYADPASMVDSVAAPEANNQGDAALDQPLWIPPGRGGVQPDLTLHYSSSNGDGWLGTGWDLDPGAVQVDTSWGVPRYDAGRESETYTLDGDQLAPTAVRTVWGPRLAERDDFSRRVDTQWEHIVRHGDNPKNYFWEVTDKMGAKRWYGGRPDCGGPDGNEPGLSAGAEPDQTRRDPSAVLTDDSGNIFRWALSAQRDVGGNLIVYYYTTETGVPVGAGAAPIGRSLYLSSINYTGWAGGQDGCAAPGHNASDPAPADPADDDRPPNVDFAYQVTLLRDGDVTPPPAGRKDAVVDARGGFANVTRELLRRVEVGYGSYDTSADPVHRPSRTRWNTLVRRYDFNYTEGAFGKSLLASVDQKGSDGHTYATNRFEYFDDVRDASGNYHGFAGVRSWSPGNDGLGQTLLGPVGTSVLGTSTTTGGGGRAYIGYNQLDGSKSGSFGGAFSINGADTEGRSEFLDINGDGLADKIFRQGGQVLFRLNQSGPSGNTTFGAALPVVNLGSLSHESTVGFEVGFEAYLGPIGVQLGTSGDVAIGDAYFTDANDDGLPDFVTQGVVLFNHLASVGGQLIPTFTGDSAQTRVPLDAATAPALPASSTIADAEKLQRDKSPLFDTVRRWLAPYDGIVAVTGAVTLDPSPATTTYASDGVRVAIQHAGDELWSTSLTAAGQSATPAGVGAIAVHAGDALYFRVGSVDSGARDQVRWDPTVTYTSLPDTTPTDVDGLDQRVFRASADFTLSGRPGQIITVPLTGTLRLDALVHKLGVTSDDARVEMLRAGAVVASTPLPWDAVGDIDASQTLAVSTGDKLTVRVQTDSPIDVRQIDWSPTLTYTAATDASGAAVPVTDANGTPTLTLVVSPDVSIYGDTSATAPSTPWTSTLGRDVTAHARLQTLDEHGPAEVTLTVKQRNVLVGKSNVAVAAGATSVDVDVPVTLTNGAGYWFDVSVHDPLCVRTSTTPCPKMFSATHLGSSVELRWTENSSNRTLAVPSTLHRPGAQTLFPVPYRGWGAAGYQAVGDRETQPIVEGDLIIDTTAFTPREPTGFDDTTYTSPADAKAEAYIPYQLAHVDASGVPDGSTAPVWRGSKDNMVVGADFKRSSRRGVDDPAFVSTATVGGAGARGVVRVGIGMPHFSIAGSLGPVGAQFAAGPSFGVSDYQDMNGDGFPDIVRDNTVVYTGPRGAYVDTGGQGLGTLVQDTSFLVGGGFEGGAADINISSTGDADTPQNAGSRSSTRRNAATTGGSASNDKVTASFGGSLGVTATFTNPATSDPNWQAQLDRMPSQLAPLEQDIADMNGDGLPDKVTADANGVLVRLNLGYRFSDTPIRWSSGGFETSQQYAGSVGPTLGFNAGDLEFAGGLAYTESVDTAEYTWVDVDGDGQLDRVRRSGDGIRVAFGTGNGTLPEVLYGQGASPSIQLGGVGIPTGQQVAQTRNRGLGGGFDFTIGIGPLCFYIDECYIIINPGIGVDHSVSTNQVQLTDVDGDGYPDSVLSDADNDLQVFSNRRGRTNLLKTVHNAIGGDLRLDYQRAGNTVDQPFPHWAMASVEVDDKRPGDGADTLLTTYEYAGERGNRLEKQVMGFATVTERQRAYQGDGNVFDDPVLRSIRRTYLNRTIFEQGLETSEELLDAAGVVQTSIGSTWAFQDPRTGNPVDVSAVAGDPSDLHLLGVAASPVRTKVDEAWYAAGTVAKTTQRTYAYDSRGNVVRQVDQGEPSLTSDDVTALSQYTSCAFRRLDADGNTIIPSFGVGGGKPAGTFDYTWVSVPEVLDVYDASNNLMRHRDALGYNRDDVEVGRPCENQSLTRLDRTIVPGRTAVDEMDYDEWGNYVYTAYPENANGDRYRVDYVYDPDSHANIADTVDNHGLRSTATFDPFTGQVASRTDANGQITSYRYDAFGRLASVTLPTEQGTGRATVAYEYHPTAVGYGYAIARHADAFRPDTIDTVSFIDGTGRVVQTKQDATVFAGVATAATDVQQVSGAIEYDALGRPVREWYPTTAPKSQEATFVATRAATAPTVTTYDVRDRETRVVAPGNRLTTTVYGYGGQPTFGAVLFTTTVNDPNGTPQRTYTDVRGNTLGVEDWPDSATLRRLTRYTYDGLGELRTVVDPAGNVTTHTYDLVGDRTSTNTPDGGLVEFGYDNAGNVISKVDPNLRAKGQRVTYRYDVERLVGIDYPAGTPSVTYTWGDAVAAAGNAGGNAAGRIVGVSDGARVQALRYDALGRQASDTSTMLVHNLNDAVGQRVTYMTSFTQDWLGRLGTVTYPDGERLTYGYDAGGLLSSIAGTKGAVTYRYLDRLEYDEFFDKRFEQTGNGVQTQYAYDANTRWLATQRTDNTTRTLQSYRFGYDAVGNVLTEDDAATLPAPGLKGGPSTQTFSYDPYYRLTSAKGTYRYPPGNTRDYTYAVTYDSLGNLRSKAQTDIVTVPGGSKVTQKPTTYTEALTYAAAKPHQIAAVDKTAYAYDANGNFVAWPAAATGGQSRTATWDAANRMTSVADQGSTTTYTYDHLGTRAIERGPAGETAFVNDWWTVRNGTIGWKTIWAGSDRLVEQKAMPDGTSEDWRYFLHKDLQGSTNVVTDPAGEVFQHLEYFPTGEIWVHEKSDVHREPYLYGGGYFDEVRQLIDMGQRWYEPREQFFYSPDPALVDEPTAAVEDANLLPAYTYAEANPLVFGDFDGRKPSSLQNRLGGLAARALGVSGAFGAREQTPAAFGSGPNSSKLKALTTSQRYKRWAELNEQFEPNPLVEINLRNTVDGVQLESVKLSLWATPQWTVFQRAPAAPAAKPIPALQQNANGRVRPAQQRAPIPNMTSTPAGQQGPVRLDANGSPLRKQRPRLSQVFTHPQPNANAP